MPKQRLTRARIIIIASLILVSAISICYAQLGKSENPPKRSRPPVSEGEILPAFTEKGYWFVEDVKLDPRDIYSYLETLKDEIAAIRSEGSLPELYTWVRLEPDQSQVSFAIPYKNYTDRSHVHLNWVEIKKKHPGLVANEFDDYALQVMGPEFNYDGGNFYSLEYALVLDVHTDNIFEFENEVKELVKVLKEVKPDFNFNSYASIIGKQPRYHFTWTGAKETNSIYDAFVPIHGVKAPLLRMIGLSQVHEQSVGIYKKEYLITKAPTLGE